MKYKKKLKNLATRISDYEKTVAKLDEQTAKGYRRPGSKKK